MQSKNLIVVSAAGSGKTTKIIENVLKNPSEKILIVTYTINNINEIKKKFYEKKGYIPNNVTILSWFEFLLRDFVRPYQNFVYQGKRIASMLFVNNKSAVGIRKSNVNLYFFAEGSKIYSDKIAEFGCMCDEKSGGLVINRLKSLYEHIYIDEVQDLAGYDINVIEILFRSSIKITLVGDHRQATFQTNNSSKNKKYAKTNIIKKFLEWEKQKLCYIQNWSNCFRCNQLICNFADSIYKDFPKTISRNNEVTGHDGCFIINNSDIDNYIKQYKPQILRYNKRINCYNNDALNFGDSKGLTFDRVLIFPHNPIKKLLESGDFNHIASSAAKFYVAVTRARYSLAIIHDGNCNLEIFKRWFVC